MGDDDQPDTGDQQQMLRLLDVTMTALFGLASAAEWLGTKVAYHRNRVAARRVDGRHGDDEAPF